jgi:1-acyl-sn-glycerol-3-phosphate acyltransferase
MKIIKILKNIPMIYKFYLALPSLREFKDGISAARASGNVEEERSYILKATSKWGSFVMNVFKTEVHIYGEENIPSEGPVVYISNHQSYADIPLCCMVLNKIQFGFVAKKELSDLFLYGEWVENIRSVLIKRDVPRASLLAIEKAISFVHQGFSILVFPEGTRSKGVQMGEFKKGSLRIATKTLVPVIPITINGTWRIFEEKGYPQKAGVDITIHKAIETKNLSKAELSELSDVVEEIIRGGLS